MWDTNASRQQSSAAVANQEDKNSAPSHQLFADLPRAQSLHKAASPKVPRLTLFVCGMAAHHDGHFGTCTSCSQCQPCKKDGWKKTFECNSMFPFRGSRDVLILT
ncbi:unnamed protein product [Arctogadus glacialis]